MGAVFVAKLQKSPLRPLDWWSVKSRKHQKKNKFKIEREINTREFKKKEVASEYERSA